MFALPDILLTERTNHMFEMRQNASFFACSGTSRFSKSDYAFLFIVTYYCTCNKEIVLRPSP